MVKRLALVTGANRGLGLETCHQLLLLGYEVIMTSRDPKKGAEAVKKMKESFEDVHYLPLDISKSASIQELVNQVKKKWGHLDVLVNNGAIAKDKETNTIEGRRKILEETLMTNVVGAYELCDSFAPLMKEKKYGRIVNVSSGLGQLSEPHSDFATYSISKTALNAVTTLFANQYKDSNILVNSVCPGWVKTDMGGKDAPRSVQDGARSIVWGAILPEQGPTGGFFRDGKPLDW